MDREPDKNKDKDKDKKPDRNFRGSSVQVKDSPVNRKSKGLTSSLERVGFLPKWVTVLLVLAALGTGGYSIYTLLQFQPLRQENLSVTPVETLPPIRYVSALGRLEPASEVIEVSATSSQPQGERLGKLLVEEGDSVRAGQTIAIMDSSDRLAAELEQVKQQVRIARAKLEQVKAGAKSGDIAAQEATISRLQAQIPRDVAVQEATISRIRAQVQGDVAAQDATLDRLEAQLQGNVDAKLAAIARLQAELDGQIATQQAAIARLEAQLQGDRTAQQAAIDRLQAQLQGDVAAQQATVARLQAELQEKTTAQQATIARLQAKLENSGVEFRRYEQLYREGAISESLYDTKRLELETALQEVKEARAKLEEIQKTGIEVEKEALATLAKIEQTGRKQLEEARATLAKIEGTGEKQIEEAVENLNRIEATAFEQLAEERAILTQLDRTGQEEINEAEVKRQQLQATGREQLNEASVTRDRISATGEQQIQEARSILDSVSEVRNVDVNLAQVEVDSALAAVEEAQVRLNEAYVRSPIDGQVMKVNTRPGETVSQDSGIVEIGQTERMFVTAEVYETDIQYVRLGQRATITSAAVDRELSGSVDRIGLKIGKKDVLDTDPTADIDARVVEVKIRLDPEDSQRVSSLTNLQVEVSIATVPPVESGE